MAKIFKKLFVGETVATSGSKCFKKLTTEEPSEPEQPALDGLFDADGVQLASWDTLVNEYGLDVETDYSNTEGNDNYYQIPAGAPYNVLQNKTEFATATHLIIGDSVKRIGSFAFFHSMPDAPSLKSLTIGNGVITIGMNAFTNYPPLLENLTLGNSVTSIGLSAFQNLDELRKITIPENVETINTNAFPDTVTHIYYNSNKITGLGIPTTASNPLNLYFNAYGEDTEILFSFSGLKGSQKGAKTYNIYTNSTTIKDGVLAQADQYTTVNVYKLDGGEW